MNNKKHSYHSGNLKGFRNSVPVTRDKDQRTNIFFIILQRVLPTLCARILTGSVSLAQRIQVLLSNTWKSYVSLFIYAYIKKYTQH